MSQAPLLKILIADDDPDDRKLTFEAFVESKLPHSISFAENGEVLLDLLERNGGKAFPDVILLDMNMPRKDGRSTLNDLHKDVRFSKIPVVIFSTSRVPDDFETLREKGARFFYTKPSTFNELLDFVKEIHTRFATPKVADC